MFITKDCIKEIKQILTLNGFKVMGIERVIDESCSPEIGFKITIKFNKKGISIQKLEKLLKNYVYSLEFV